MNVSTGAAALVLACAAAAHAQVANGDFETGNLTGWTVGFTPNGATAVQLAEQFDIDGPGPLGTNFAAKFSAGNAAAPNLPIAGVELTQSVALTSGTVYTFDFDWAAVRTIATQNTEGGRFALIVDGVELAVQNAGPTSSTLPHYGHINAPFTAPSTGNFTVGVRITRQFTIPTPTAPTLFQYVDNFTMAGGTAPCYPDCDGDDALTLADFGCFQTKFALGDLYADCNGDQVLNLADFGCFQTAFALGCP